MDNLIKAVREHALDPANYEAGWDYLVECWTDEEIAEELTPNMTPKMAIKKLGKIMKTYRAYGDEIRSTAW